MDQRWSTSRYASPKLKFAPMVGCRIAIVDRKTQSIGFYEKCGFTLLDMPENRDIEHPFMYLDLRRAQLALPSPPPRADHRNN
ncbi:hypothetical protein [Mesorhizobium sp. 43Arga]